MESLASPPQEFYVVSNRHGFVGAYLAYDVAAAVVRRFPTLRFVVQKYPLEPGPREHIWLVLYQANDLVAFASNSREKALEVQKVYGSIGAAHDEDLDYWKQPLGVIPKIVQEQLNSEHRAHVMYAGPLTDEAYRNLEAADAKRVEQLMTTQADGPLERAFRENEHISILRYVVASSLGGAPESASVGTPSDASVGTPADAPVGTPADAPAGAPSIPPGAGPPTEVVAYLARDAAL